MPTPLYANLEQNRKALNQMFGQSTDFYAKPIRIRGVPCLVCMFDGLSNTEKLWVILLDRMSRAALPARDGASLFEWMMEDTDLPLEPDPAKDFETVSAKLTGGLAVLLAEGCSQALLLSNQSMQGRSVAEPSGEGDIRGSREGFCDLLRVNVSLLRRLDRAEGLVIELFQLDTHTRTEAALCYDRDLAPPELVAEARRRLKASRLPLVLDSSYLAPDLQRGQGCFFSQVGYTERSATACAKLCEGKVVVLVNGSPFALILPYFFAEHFQSLDDYAQKAYFASFVRGVKYLAFWLAALLPGLYVCVAKFMPEVFPRQLLVRIAAAESATPWPLFLEMVLVILLLEIVREAGLRLPKPIGHSVSLVSALIIGDAAIGAGILSTPVVIVAALTSLAVFVLPSLYEPLTILRILFVLAAGLCGPLGVAALLVWMLTSICGAESFGLPHAAPFSPWQRGAVRDGLMRWPWPALADHPFTVRAVKRGGGPHR